MLTAKLAHFGVVQEDPKPSPIATAEFDAEAHETLSSLVRVVGDAILPDLPEMVGTWHPTGFMVFRLGHHTRLGSLRLHVWPRNLRRREAKGRGRLGVIHDGDIHDHAWGVASAVLADYRDTMYDVTTSPRADGALPHCQFRVFTVAYGERAHNALVTDGRCVEAVPRDRRVIPAGEFHSIAPGDFHAPTVPDDAFSATLVFSGPRALEHGPHVLIGGGVDPIVGNRVPTTAGDAALARAQLSAAL